MNSCDEKSYIDLAVTYFEQNKMQEAKDSLLLSINSGENLVNSYNNLAWICHYENDNVNAEKYFQSALMLEPDNVALLMNLGDFYYSIEKTDLALDYYLKCISISVDDDGIYYKIANCYLIKNFISEAISFLEKAIVINPSIPEYYKSLAKIYYKKNKFENAEYYFEKLLEFNIEREWVYTNLGNIYFYEYENIEKAYEFYQKAYIENPDYCWALYNLANVKLVYDEIAEAIDLYNKAYQIYPANTLFLLSLIRAYYKIKDYENAKKLAIDYMEKNEFNIDIMLLLVRIYIEFQNDLENAKNIINKILTVEKENAEVYYLLAKISYLDFNSNNAIINIDKAINLENNDKYLAFRNKIQDELTYG